MRDKKLKVMYFSLNDSSVKEISFGWKSVTLVATGALLILLLMVATGLALFTDVYHNVEVTSLSKTNSILKQQLGQLGAKVERIQGRIEHLEVRDNELRISTNLPLFDDDVRNLGVGGSELQPDLGSDFVGAEKEEQEIRNIQQLLDTFDRKLSFLSESGKTIESRLASHKDKLKRLPSIRPILEGEGRVTDRFGNRFHPIYERIKHHDGIDISAPEGTKVYAPAYGVVEKVVTKYRRNKGYGREVLINHGNGIKTRYGHFKQILVKKGQKVNRWDLLGLVGQTGLATGPHLHYEVIQDGRAIDPEKFIFDSDY